MGRDRDVFLRRSDGSALPVEIGLSPISTPDGSFTLASIVDITERKRREDELRRSNADLEQFAYIASHDLQEPLRMVASYTELLGQRYKGQLDAKADLYIHYAVDGAKRMQVLIRDLLAYSRVGTQGKAMVPVSSEAVVHTVLRSMRRAIEEADATLQVGELPVVNADEGQLHQLFQNFVANALKFRSPDRPPIIRITASFTKERWWSFSVSDNGIGIEPGDHERVFQMFQRLHAIGTYEGSGIGLAIVKRIIDRHGGRIWIESEAGKGTTFHFTLPAVPA